MRREHTAEFESMTPVPGWIVPPGASGYRACQRRQLRDFLLWLLLVLVLLLAFGWPYLQYAASAARDYNVAYSEPRP